MSAAAQTKNMFLYWGSGSGYCWRAMLALEEKGLHGYPNKLLSFEDKTIKIPELMKLNPRGEVPTFHHGDVVVNESMAICEYLEHQFKSQGTTLVPADAAQAAVVRQRQFEAENLVRAITRDLIYYRFYTENPDLSKISERKEKLLAELSMWEGYLKEGGTNSFLAGPDFTMADVAAYPFLAFAVRFGLKFNPKLPLLASYYDRVTQRPSVQASWPPHWKESPPKDFLSDVIN